MSQKKRQHSAHRLVPLDALDLDRDRLVLGSELSLPEEQISMHLGKGIFSYNSLALM